MSKTPDEKWKESILEYRKNCQKILKISKSIRYAGVINEYGRTLAGMMSPGLKPLLRPEEAKNEFFIISNLITLRHSQSKEFGPLEHAVIKHGKATIICIPSKNVVYYISADPKSKSGQIAKRVKSLI